MQSGVGAHDLGILLGSVWSATPHDYSSLRYLKFEQDGRGQAVYGYGQTLYAKIHFAFELTDDPALRLRYAASPAAKGFPAFEPSPEAAGKLIPYTLVRGEYRGVESIVAWPFVCEWLLTLADFPWPAGMTFPRGMPTQFYGYRRNEPRPAK